MEYSVVTTVYNDENGIIQFLDEICGQNKVPKEIVIADGGGTDSTRRLIKEYAKVSVVPIKLYEGKRLNIAEGFNKAIREADADIVGIVAVGNHYPYHFFSTLCEVLEEQEVDAAFSIIKGCESTKFSKVYNKIFSNGEKGYPSNHGILIRKNCVEELGYFYEDFYFAGEDEEFFGHFLEKGKCAICTDKACIFWESPKNWKEYYRQCKLYLIAQMQMYSNVVLLKMFWKYGFYVLGALSAFVFLVFSETRVCGIAILLVYFLANGFFMCKKGLDACILYNITYFYKLILFIRYKKYFFETNKISKWRRLKTLIKYKNE
ncbi:MAG: glycosyltransferase [bacterium]|nr:glycosyltransferase [bacterium]